MPPVGNTPCIGSTWNIGNETIAITRRSPPGPVLSVTFGVSEGNVNS